MEVHDNGRKLYEKIGNAAMSPEEYGYGTNNVNRRIQLMYGENAGYRYLQMRRAQHHVSC